MYGLDYIEKIGNHIHTPMPFTRWDHRIDHSRIKFVPFQNVLRSSYPRKRTDPCDHDAFANACRI